MTGWSLTPLEGDESFNMHQERSRQTCELAMQRFPQQMNRQSGLHCLFEGDMSLILFSYSECDLRI